MIASSACAKLV